MPSTRTRSRDNAGHLNAVIRDMTVNYNKAVLDLEYLRMSLAQDVLLAWTGVFLATATTPIGIGTTTQNVSTGAFTFSAGGVPERKAAVAAGTALPAGTIPINQWGSYSLDVATGGAITVTAAAANGTTGYATEALAIAAVPKPVTAKARIGYFTVKTGVGTTFVPTTDALATGAGGNPASATNYYPTFGVATPTGDRNYVGGANGILVQTEMSRGSTDTRVGYTAFTYNANGITALAGAVSAAGTAFGALGTIPADKWGLIVLYMNAAGVVSFQSAPLNYSTGYVTEAAAKKDLVRVTKPAGIARLGYVTILTKAATAFIVGTDALAGGASGNVATTTNYYNQTGLIGGIGVVLPYQAGMQAAEIGDGLSSGIDADLSASAFSQLINSGGT